MATTSGNTEETGSLADTDLSDRKSKRQTRFAASGETSGEDTSFLSESISDLQDSVSSLSRQGQGSNGANSARPLRLGQSLALSSEWGDVSSSTLGDPNNSSGGLGGGLGSRTSMSMRSIIGASKRASNRSRGRSSITLNRLNTHNLGIVGRDQEKALLRDAYARVAGTQGKSLCEIHVLYYIYIYIYIIYIYISYRYTCICMSYISYRYICILPMNHRRNGARRRIRKGQRRRHGCHVLVVCFFVL